MQCGWLRLTCCSVAFACRNAPPQRAAACVQERSIEKDVATLVKKTLDENLGGTWHVVVGESFGCSVTHETKYIAFFQLGLVYFLVFRSLDDEPIPED